MKSRMYVKRIIKDISENRNSARSEMADAEKIFEQIKNLPSPFKEEAFVTLVIERHQAKTTEMSSRRAA